MSAIYIYIYIEPMATVTCGCTATAEARTADRNDGEGWKAHVQYLPLLFDTHCHLAPPSEAEPTALAGMACMSIEEKDWETMVAQPHPLGPVKVLLRGIGVHPWRAHLASQGWSASI